MTHRPEPLPWPFFICVGVVGGAVGVMGLSVLIAAIQGDRFVRRHITGPR